MVTNSFVAHEPIDGLGNKAGGVALVALMHASLLRQGRVLAPNSNPPQGSKFSLKSWNLNRPSNNDELLEMYRQDKWKEFFKEVLSKGDRTIAHYYVAGVALELGLDPNHPVVYMGHSWDRVVQTMDRSRKPSKARLAQEQYILKSARAIITATEAEKKILATEYAGAHGLTVQNILDKTYVVPLGVDRRRFNPQATRGMREELREKRLPQDQQDATVFYVLGRMSPQKGQLTAVRAAIELLTQEPGSNFSLALVGGPLQGEYYKEVLEAIKSAKPFIQKRIHVFDAMDPVQAHSLGDVFVLPSTWETFGLVGPEAMALEKPVIYNKLPILEEVGGDAPVYVNLEHDPSGTSKMRDSNAVATAMVALLLDKKLRMERVTASIRRAAELGWKPAGEKLNALFKTLETK